MNLQKPKGKHALKTREETFCRLEDVMFQDLKAIKQRDPAARSLFEIFFLYSGFHALVWYRMAHFFHKIRFYFIARLLSQLGKFFTGVEIHPGATIGRGLVIDHGTGIVVGETTVIGENVKIYQGVTLGALSTRGGQSLRGKRRHPTIEDNVTIYAGASVLGGDTVIGHDCLLGSNVFITRSVEPCTTVSIKSQELQFKARSGCNADCQHCSEACWKEEE